MKQSTKTKYGVTAGVVLLALGYVLGTASADGIPTAEPLVYSGTLLEGGTAVEGERSIWAALWRDATSTMSADQVCITTPRTITVTAGRFRLALDPACVSAVHDEADLWIEVQVGGTIFPRSHIAAAPYAIESERAVDALGADRFVVRSGLDVSGEVTMLGDATTALALDTTYTAATDGFVIAFGGGAAPTSHDITVTPPSGPSYGCRHEADYTSTTCPVPRGSTWRVARFSAGTGTGSITWIPLGR